MAPPGENDGTCNSFSPPEPTTQTANQSVQPFLHSSQQKVPILYNGRPLIQKLPLPMGDMDPHLIHGSLGQSESSTQTASRTVQPFFAGLTSITERLTDRLTEHDTRSVTMGCVYISSTAMWLKNSDDVINSTYNVFRKKHPRVFSSITSSQMNQFAQKFQHL